MVKKSIFLFLALVLPVLIYLFLKGFGKNEFEVTPLFQDSVQVSSGCKGLDYSIPYVISDTVYSQLGSTVNSVNMVVVKDSLFNQNEESTIQLTRVFKEFAQNELNLLFIEQNGENETKSAKGGFKSWVVSDSEYKKIKECVFLLDELNNAVLIDSRKRIVGQYDLTSREDTDRLILELRILLKKY